ncbi:MAG: S-layer homology domain-containing protein [Oscillospiraceae bacterium]|nr:S-layer homology domain-containing protein [Oscillospiraceae bacterium]
MKNAKRRLALLTAAILAFTLLANFGAQAFDDIADNSPNQQRAIHSLRQIGIVHGVDTGSTRFAPNDPICRSAFVKLLYTASNNGIHDNAVNYRSRPNPFADVNTTNWAYGYLVWALENGIISGTGHAPDGRVIFHPRGQIRLVEAMKGLLGLIGYCPRQLGFSGSGWRQNIMTHGINAGLRLPDFAHIGDMDFMTRADAVLLAYAAFNVSTVRTVSGVVMPNNVNFLYSEIGMRRVEGTVVANDAVRLVAVPQPAGSTVLFAVDASGSDIFENRAGQFITIENAATDASFIGQQVFVVARFSDANTATTNGPPAHNPRYRVTATYSVALNAGNTSVPVYINYSRTTSNMNATIQRGRQAPLYIANQQGQFLTPFNNISYILDEQGRVLRVLAEEWVYGRVTQLSDTHITVLGANDGALLIDNQPRERETDGPKMRLGDIVFAQVIGTIGGTRRNTMQLSVPFLGNVRQSDPQSGRLLIDSTWHNLSINPQRSAAHTLQAFLDLTGSWRFTLDKAGNIIDWTPENPANAQRVGLITATMTVQERDGPVCYAIIQSSDNVLRSLPVASINGVRPTDAHFAAQFNQLTENMLIAYTMSNNQWTLIAYSSRLSGFDIHHASARIDFDVAVSSRITVAGNEYTVNPQTRFFVRRNGVWETFTGAPSFNVSGIGEVHSESRATYGYARIVVIP